MSKPSQDYKDREWNLGPTKIRGISNLSHLFFCGLGPRLQPRNWSDLEKHRTSQKKKKKKRPLQNISVFDIGLKGSQNNNALDICQKQKKTKSFLKKNINILGFTLSLRTYFKINVRNTHTHKGGMIIWIKTNRKTDDRKDPQFELLDQASKITKFKVINAMKGMLRTSTENWNNKEPNGNFTTKK